jgi:hypothetical protein
LSELIQPIVDCFKAILQGMTADQLGDLPAFRGVDQVWNGTLINSPEAHVLGIRTSFPDRGEGSARNQVHAVTIRLGITGTDPESLVKQAIRYVQAVDLAIDQFAGWPDYFKYCYVAVHDYGPLFARANGLAVWPDIHCEVEVEELL